MSQAPSVDISKYLEDKAAGNASIIKIDGKVHLRAVSPQPAAMLVPVDRKAISDAIEAKRAEIVTLETMLLDIDSAAEVVV